MIPKTVSTVERPLLDLTIYAAQHESCSESEERSKCCKPPDGQLSARVHVASSSSQGQRVRCHLSRRYDCQRVDSSSQDARQSDYRPSNHRCDDRRNDRRDDRRNDRCDDRRNDRPTKTAGVSGVGLPDAVVAVALITGVGVGAIRILSLRVLVVGLPDLTGTRPADSVTVIVAVP